MESELDLLLGTAIDSLVKLEIVLYLHSRPGVVRTPEQIGAQLRRPVAEVVRAMEELSEAGLIDRFRLGTGKHVMYGPTEDAHVQELLALLHEQYHSDPAARARIVLVALQKDSLRESESPPAGDP